MLGNGGFTKQFGVLVLQRLAISIGLGLGRLVLGHLPLDGFLGLCQFGSSLVKQILLHIARQINLLGYFNFE